MFAIEAAAIGIVAAVFFALGLLVHGWLSTRYRDRSSEAYVAAYNKALAEHRAGIVTTAEKNRQKEISPYPKSAKEEAANFEESIKVFHPDNAAEQERMRREYRTPP